MTSKKLNQSVNKPNGRRMGIIDVSSLVMREATFPKVLAGLGFLPFKVDYQPDIDCYRMLGTSQHFNSIDFGTPAPTYKLTIHVVNGEYSHVVAEQIT